MMSTATDWLPRNHKTLKETAVKARTYLNVPENYDRMRSPLFLHFRRNSPFFPAFR
jgi:hypothetical protein